ncbi:hypothetical protein BU15DRAFT_69194, partial [Melanogaster broomeanus]
MPGLSIPQPPHYVPARRRTRSATTSAGRAQLAQEVKDAFRTHGFFYVINHGLRQAPDRRMFDIADIPMSGVSDEEKRTYAGDSHATGLFQGYKPRQYWARSFSASTFLRRLFVNMHNFDVPGGTYGLPNSFRTFIKLLMGQLSEIMKYFPRSEEDEVRTKNVWMKDIPHIDNGVRDQIEHYNSNMTLLWSQPVAALQIQTNNGWRWIRHIDNALIVNAGDALEFLTGGFYKGTIHRVIQPPPDQRGYTRVGIIYFAYPDDNAKLVPLSESPVLQQAGIERKCDDSVAPSAGAWRVARVSAYGSSTLKKSEKPNIEEEVLHGIIVWHCRSEAALHMYLEIRFPLLINTHSLTSGYIALALFSLPPLSSHMPSVTLPPTPHYNPASPTRADLDYADLPIIDLAKAQSSEERQQLAFQVQDALLTHGFFYVVNHGYLRSKVRMFDIADIPFSGVSDDEKQVYAGTMKQTGSWQGYKLRQYFHIDNGVRDQIEHYNINRDVTKRDHPEAVRPFLPEIREFARFNHLNVLHPIL